MSSDTTITVSKLDAARRQLETAIALYFQHADPVSIHTLACAAHEIIETLNKRQGGQPTLKASLRNDIKAEFVKEFSQRLDAAKNFFKHADRDPDESIQFTPFESEIVLLDTCWTHQRLTKVRLPVPGTFVMWSTITWAKEFVSYPGLDVAAPEPMRLSNLSRQEFFREFLPIALDADGTHLP